MGVSGPRLGARVRLGLEFILVFLVVPLVAAGQGSVLRRWVIPQLLVLAVLALLVLWRDRRFDWSSLRALPANWPTGLRRIVIVWLLGGTVLLAICRVLMPVSVFGFARAHPALWIAALVVFPVLSALPQELVFRTFVFHRYAALFPGPRALALASACAFALAHLQLGNALAPALSFLGGLLFSSTYARTRSLPMVTLEHGLWGDWIFTIGLGGYFYGGGF